MRMRIMMIVVVMMIIIRIRPRALREFIIPLKNVLPPLLSLPVLDFF